MKNMYHWPKHCRAVILILEHDPGDVKSNLGVYFLHFSEDVPPYTIIECDVNKIYKWHSLYKNWPVKIVISYIFYWNMQFSLIVSQHFHIPCLYTEIVSVWLLLSQAILASQEYKTSATEAWPVLRSSGPNQSRTVPRIHKIFCLGSPNKVYDFLRKQFNLTHLLLGTRAASHLVKLWYFPFP